MAAKQTPYGLLGVSRLGARGGDLNIREIALQANNTSAIFAGDPVRLASGVVIPFTASPTPGAGTAVIGVFVGCYFTDPTFGLREQMYLPANAYNTYGPGGGFPGAVVCKVTDDPYIIMQVQASGSLTLANIGNNAGLKNFTAGNVNTGNSGVQLDTGAMTQPGTGYAVRIIDLVNKVGFSTPGDAYTDALVIWNFGVHQYQAANGQ